MDYDKLVGRAPAEWDDKDHTTVAVAEIVVKMIASGSTPDSASTRDPDGVIDGLLMGLALVLEQALETKTPSALRKMTERMGKTLLYHAKVAREMFEYSGVHPIASMLESYSTPSTVN